MSCDFSAFGCLAVDLKMSRSLPSTSRPGERDDVVVAVTIESASSTASGAALAGAGAAASTVGSGSLASSSGTATRAAISRTATGHSRRCTI